MVKRAKSPDLPDDAKYLVVHQPYPLNANFELPGDYIAFAFWAATVIGRTTEVWGIHHKPKARSTVILEVDKNLPKASLQALLGEHRWDEILKDPRDEEKERMSKAYFCLYRTQRAAQKDGWKRIHVEQEWFVEKGWNLTGGPFKHPYPATHWCPPLPEDPTNKNIARPLPISMKPPPPPQPTLVPGSSEWVEAVQAGRPTADENAKAWAQGGKKGKGRGGRGGVSMNRGRPATQRATSSQTAPVGLANTAATSRVAWSRISASSSSATTKPSSPTPSSYPNAPPGLTLNAPLVPPGLAKVEIELASMGLSDSEDEDGGVPVRFDGEDSGDDLDALLSAPVDSRYIYGTPSGSGSGSGSTPAEPAAPPAPVNLWAQLEKQNFPEDEEPMCSVHGKLCKKGICAERKQLEREKKRKEEKEERERKIKEKGEKKKEKRKQRKEGQNEDGLSRNRFRRAKVEV